MAKRNSVLLTKRVVDAIEADGTRFRVWDKELPGFGIRVERSGAKFFVAKYRTNGGGRSAGQRVLTIGRYGPLTVDEARKLAKVKLGSAAAGADPSAELKAKRREMTVKALIDFYEKTGCVIQRGKRQGQPMKSRTKQYTLDRLRNHVVPLLGQKRAPELNAGDIEQLAADITAGKTARDEKVGPRKRIIVRGGPGAARKVVRDISAVFSFAMRHEIMHRNPCDKAAVRKTDNQNEVFLTLQEVVRLGAALLVLEEEGVNPKAVNIARLWALTGCRREEIAGLRKAEVNLVEAQFEFGDSKTGKSIRPLGAAAVELLERLLAEGEGNDSAFVFPAERGDRYYQGTKSVWQRAVAKAELTNVTPHTLRHTIGSTAITAGETMAMTGAILGHTNPRSTAIYAHVQRDPSRRAANRVSKKIADALAGSAGDFDASPAPHNVSSDDEALISRLLQRLAKGDHGASVLRSVITDLTAKL